MIVECDGHDFHEKTKKQAKHDKKRDRYLTSFGYTVFRFTGSEIYKDPVWCVCEVFEYLQGSRNHEHLNKRALYEFFSSLFESANRG